MQTVKPKQQQIVSLNYHNTHYNNTWIHSTHAVSE